MSQKNNELIYQGDDLEAMIGAENYYQWIMAVIKPYLGQSIVEVGAGVGSFSRLLLSIKPQKLTLIEPSKMYDALKQNVKSDDRTKVQTLNGYLSSEKAAVKKQRPDTFVYVNVMEHIKDDGAEIKQVADLLSKGGTLVIFVPAFQGLYSEFDKSIDHYRRYTKADLRKLMEEAGLEVTYDRYMDMIGILPWFLSFVMMKRTTLVPTLVKVYDKLCIPIIRLLESVITVPVGKNVLVVGRKK